MLRFCLQITLGYGCGSIKLSNIVRFFSFLILKGKCKDAVIHFPCVAFMKPNLFLIHENSSREIQKSELNGFFVSKYCDCALLSRIIYHY